MSSYKKGKDIKVPFDCLWYYFTRSVKIFSNSGIGTWSIEAKQDFAKEKPEDFNKW